MNETLTSTIPAFAVEAMKDRRIASARQESSIAEATPPDPKDAFVSANSRNPKASLWRLTRDTTAAAALAFIIQSGEHMPITPTPGEFLSVMVDRGVSRPMITFSEIKGLSRAAASMQPMNLSRADVVALEKMFKSGSARPKVKIAQLPPYEG